MAYVLWKVVMKKYDKVRVGLNAFARVSLERVDFSYI